MDQKTKELVEAAEDLVRAPIYPTFRTYKDTIIALCAIIREQAAQLELLASATKVGAGEVLVLVAGKAMTDGARRVATDALYKAYPRPMIILPYEWSTLPIDELRKVLNPSGVSGVEK